MSYLVWKWIHIVAVISWLAGVLYLYRLFVYHVQSGEKSQDNHELLSLMERRLLYCITHPAMGLTWIAGIAMIVLQPVWMKAGWMHSKLLLVVILTFVTVFAGRIHRKLKARETTFSSRTLRIMNEVPTLLMVLIVALVVFKPL